VQATLAATAADSNGFLDLGLSAAVLQALVDVGYEAATPIQAATIPAILAGSDVLGQAQTGTGKTAAFALPILSKIDLSKPQTQALVLVPTRELAIQVAEAFQRYATHMQGFHVLPIYGGQSYVPQLKGLKRGAHVIVGTPGRVMDHMKRGTLPLDSLTYLVLDEADEMLQMGFIDAIEWVLQQTPPTRQIALFSATVPPAIRRIAQKHQRSPAEITIRSKTSTAPNIKQRYWLVSGMHKLDALTRILEVESFDAMLIFVRTKIETVELAERLEARGFEAAPLNGDIPQQQRERTIAALKAGKVDIVVATDVAARGLDVERISHVVNYDVPYDSESYIHRIGRTGRAGRSGEAILFIAPRERNMLRTIERATRQQITQMNLPSIAAVNEQRVAKFKQRIADTLAGGELEAFRSIVEQFQAENEVPAIEIAAALASLLQGSTPLLLPERAEREGEGWSQRRDERGSGRDRDVGGHGARGGQRDEGGGRGGRGDARGDSRGRHRAHGDADGRGFQGANRADGGGRGAQDANRRDDGGREFQGANRGDAGGRGAQDANRGPDGGREFQGADRGDAGRRGAQGANRGDGGGREFQSADRSDAGGRRAHGANRRDDGGRELQGADRGDAGGPGFQRDNRADDGGREFQGADRSDAGGAGFQSADRSDAGARGPQDADRGGDGGPGFQGADRAAAAALDSPAGGRELQSTDSGDAGAVSSQPGPNGDRGSPGREAVHVRGGGETPVGDGSERRPNRDRPVREVHSRAERRRRDDTQDVVFETFRLEVGHTHGVKPGNIVGAIANEAGLEGRHIGHVDIRDDHSFVDLPEGMPKDIFRNLKKVRVVGQELRISRVDGKPPRQH
jgi:ATP-dependent RNA helicase DeaD